MKVQVSKKQQIAVILLGLLLALILAALMLFLPHGKQVESFGESLICKLSDGNFLRGEPSGVVHAEDGSFYVTDRALHVIWRVTEDKSEIVAGQIGAVDSRGVVEGGYADGAADQARFNTPSAILKYQGGYLISDALNHVIRYFDPVSETVVTFAGSGAVGEEDGTLTEASFASPAGMCTDEAGNLYVADPLNHAIRKIDPEGYVSTFLGTTQGNLDGSFEVAQLSYPSDVAVVGDTFYIADTGNHAIRCVEAGELVTLCGGEGHDHLASPTSVFADGETVWVSDSGLGALCSIRNKQFSVLVRSGAKSALPISPQSICVEADVIYIADAQASRLERIAR